MTRKRKFFKTWMQDLSIWSWLQSRFPASSKDWTVGELVRAAFLEHGVNVQSEGALFQFKYEFSVVKWTLYSGQARGIIMKRANNCWIPVAIPFFKFFNQQESKCPVQSGQAFALALKEGMMFVEKADGTGWKILEKNSRKKNDKFFDQASSFGLMVRRMRMTSSIKKKRQRYHL